MKGYGVVFIHIKPNLPLFLILLDEFKIGNIKMFHFKISVGEKYVNVFFFFKYSKLLLQNKFTFFIIKQNHLKIL